MLMHKVPGIPESSRSVPLKTIKVSGLFFRLAVFFIVMPYVGAFFLPTDIQPYALVAALTYIFLSGTKEYLYLFPIFIPLLIIFLFALSSAAINILAGVDSIFLVLRSLWGYVTPFVIFSFVWLSRRVIIDSDRLVQVLDLCLLLIFVGFVFQLLGFNNIIQQLVSRAVFDFDTLSARGLTSFHPEQSRVSEQLLLMGVLYATIGRLNKKRLLAIIVGGVLSFAGQFVVSVLQVLVAIISGSILIALSSRLMVVHKKRLFLAFTGIMLLVFGALLLPDLSRISADSKVPARFSTAISALNESPLALLRDRGAQIKVSGAIYAFSSVVASPFTFDIIADERDDYWDMVYPVGSRLVEVVFDAEFYRTQRPYTAIGQWIIHFGIFGFFASLGFIFLLFKSVWNAERRNGKRLTFVVCFFVLVQLLFLKLPLANPTLWFAVAVLWLFSTTKFHNVKSDGHNLMNMEAREG